MSENSKIEWTDHTFNPWIGCSKVSPGCANCYAETQDKFRSWTPEGWGFGKPRKRTSAANWNLPLKWNREAEQKRVMDLHSWPAGKPMPVIRPRVFCASLADWLDDEVPIEWFVNLLEIIHATPNLDWLLLTKRPENWRSRVDAAFQFGDLVSRRHFEFINWLGAWTQPPMDLAVCPSNVWIGTTVENQEMADRRIPYLLSIPAKIRFLSCEPLLGPVDLRKVVDWWNSDEKIHWCICGGESGPHARPMHPDWARSLRDQCKAANVPFFMKQMGGVRKPFAPIPEDIQIRQFPSL